MRDLDHAERLVRAVVDAARVPVSLKMRLGWDDASLNAADLARRAVAAGVRLLTVHGRTRQQFFKGRADWSGVKPVVDAVDVPVVVNGDIVTLADAREALTRSGAAGVMIGRGAYGAPWQPGRIGAGLESGVDPGPPALAVQRDVAVEHISAMLEHYGRELGARNARKHIGWYLESSGAACDAVKDWRRRLCTESVPARAIAGLVEFYSRLEADELRSAA
jgi:nifR3 family TIM-barrel protein